MRVSSINIFERLSVTFFFQAPVLYNNTMKIKLLTDQEIFISEKKIIKA